jgi:hypothetical protein
MNTTAMTMVPAVVEMAVKPKPTKDEILTAMAHLHIEKLKKENEERKVRHEAAEQKIEKLLVKLAKKAGALSEPSTSWSWYKGQAPYASVHFRFKEDELTDELKSLMKIAQDSQSFCIPSLYDAKRQVRQAMGDLVTKNDRVNALLADKGSRAALEKALEKLDT